MIALGSGLALAAPLAASAATEPVSFGEGQFLSGTLAGTDLGRLVELHAAWAANNGAQGMQSSDDPLGVDVLSQTIIDTPEGVQLSLGDFLDSGVLHQYARASRDGSSMASSGAIGNDGGVGVGVAADGTAGDLNVDLNALLGAEFSTLLTDLHLDLDAVGAHAVGILDTAYGNYNLAGAHLTFTSPAIAGLTDRVNAALGPVDRAIAKLDGDDGALGLAVERVLDPVLAITGSTAHVSANISTDIRGAVHSLLDGQYGNDAVQFNLETGEVTVDLAALLGGELNNLPANTELLTDTVINQILTGITDTVSTLADQIVDRVRVELDNGRVDIRANLDLLTAQAPIRTRECSDIRVPIIGDIAVVGGTTRGIVGYSSQAVCEIISSAVPDLHSTVNVTIQGSVNQILDGTADRSDVSVSLLDETVQPAININGIMDGLLAGLTDELFDANGAVAQVVDKLNTGLVHPTTAALLGSGQSIDTVLSDVLSIRVNVQEISPASTAVDGLTAGSVFTETAVRVAVLPAAEEEPATMNFGSARVGPNAERIVDDPNCTENCTPPDGDPCVGVCSTGTGTHGNIGTAAERLAMTGVGIATLVAIVLALLAAGAYLAREGYRRNHPKSLA